MKRNKDECYYDYQARRQLQQENYRDSKRGRLLHCSAVMINKGTILKPVWEKLVVKGTRVLPKDQRKIKVGNEVMFPIGHPGPDLAVCEVLSVNNKKKTAVVRDHFFKITIRKKFKELTLM